ncbi:MAG: Hsp20/alpha crystallin family protein [Armatimonadetes bacterium]|nr:Hsp20/alpha crystallin family protein [Armatimonadota bacterium]
MLPTLGATVSKSFDSLFRQMEQEMERMTRDALRRFDRDPTRGPFWQPRVDVCETQDALLVLVELAGLSEEEISRQIDITLTADNRALVVAGHRQEPGEDGARTRCHQLEIHFGPFERVVPLPTDVKFERERLSATYRSGLLRIELPKRPPEEPRMIPVGGG